MADSQGTSTVDSGAGSVSDTSASPDLESIDSNLTDIVGQIDVLNQQIQELHDSINTLLVGISSIEMFILLSLLLLVGIIAALIFVVALRKL